MSVEDRPISISLPSVSILNRPSPTPQNAGQPNHGTDHNQGNGNNGNVGTYNNAPPPYGSQNHYPGDGRILRGDHIPTPEEKAQQFAEAARIQAQQFAEAARIQEERQRAAINAAAIKTINARITVLGVLEKEKAAGHANTVSILQNMLNHFAKPPKDAIEPIHFLEDVIFASRFALFETLNFLYNTSSLIYEAILSKQDGTLGNTFPENPTITGHIFRDKMGHIEDTPANRQLIKDVCNKTECYLGRDIWDNRWFAGKIDEVRQVWVRVREGKITDAGINNTPKDYNPRTGLTNPKKPTQNLTGFGGSFLGTFHSAHKQNTNNYQPRTGYRL